jgi:iron complex outermembrane recepter protein
VVNELLNTRFKTPVMALAVSGFALSSAGSFAQDAENEARAPRSGLETIVVQAQKRAEDTQTVPIAVTAVTGKALEQRFAQDFRDLTSAAPNVLLEPVGSFQNASSFFIRGAGSSDIESAADPGIAILVDGVYQARTSTALVDFVDVSAVEILRGPQGTLFGRNAIGGAVLLRHNPPDVDGFGADFAVTAGQYGRLDIKGMANLVLVEGKAAFRVAFKSTNLDGYYKNIFSGTPEDAGEIDRITVLPSFRFTNENLDVVIRGEYNRTRDDAYPTVAHNACLVDPAGGDEWFNLLGGNDLVIAQTALNLGGEAARELCAFEADDTDRAYTINANDSWGDGSQFDVWGIGAEVNYSIPDVGTITYLGNYRDVHENVANDFDTTPLELFETVREQWHYQTSHELRFASEFSDTVDFVAGFY